MKIINTMLEKVTGVIGKNCYYIFMFLFFIFLN